jgi:hypothetical protein
MNLSEAQTFVTISVGGKRFETTISTLTRVPDSYFSIISSGHWKKTEENIIRIDRNPRFFEYILDYLRHGLGDMYLPESIYTEDSMLSFYHESIFYGLNELTDYILKIICIENWAVLKRDVIPTFVDADDNEKLLQHVTLAVYEAPNVISIGMHWLERNFPQSPLIQILNVERLRFLTNPESHHSHSQGVRPDFSSLMERHRFEKSNEDLATYCMRQIIMKEALHGAVNEGLLSTQNIPFQNDVFHQQNVRGRQQQSFSAQIQEAWKRRINRVGINQSIQMLQHSPHHHQQQQQQQQNKIDDVGVSYTHCLFVSRGGQATSSWVYPLSSTTSSLDKITPMLSQRQFKYANMFKEVNNRKDTMQNLAPIEEEEEEERIATPWK